MSSTQVKISVPANHLMPALLGPRDEVLRAVEAAFPDVSVHVRGNEIALEGPDAEQVAALFEDLVVLVEQGHQLDPSIVRRSVDMVRQHELLERVAALVDAGTLRTTASEHFGTINAANLRRAHALVESHRSRGKAVLAGF